MLRFGVSTMVKYLIGILLVQGGTVLLVVTALRTSLDKTGLLFALLTVAVGALTALWFTSIANGARRESLAKAKESFSREREKIRVRAEQEKIKEVRSSQRRVAREQRKVRTGSNLKTGVMIGGAVGVGAVLLMTQMVTLGLLTLSTAGGAALGYGVRARQDRLGQGGRRLLRQGRPVRVIEAQPSSASPTQSGDELQTIRDA